MRNSLKSLESLAVCMYMILVTLEATAPMREHWQWQGRHLVYRICQVLELAIFKISSTYNHVDYYRFF